MTYVLWQLSYDTDERRECVLLLESDNYHMTQMKEALAKPSEEEMEAAMREHGVLP